jgi:uncharacterized lipoprotein YmbA
MLPTDPEANAKVVLGAVHVSTYIDDLGLVLETDEGVVHSARFHQWAEPLRESIRTFIATEISASAGHGIHIREYKRMIWDKRIDLRIDQLHGTADGHAILVAFWSVSGGDGQVLSTSTFSETGILQRDGYNALVEAEKVLLQQLAISIAGKL